MPEHDNKRRKVRKGTRSCWECRRRKIRCQYASQEDGVCVGCQGRGTTCISQEYADEQLPPQPDRRLAQRLGRLEELMERLVDKIAPETLGSSADSFRTSPSAASVDDDGGHGIDVMEGSVAEDTPVLSILGMSKMSASSASSPSTAAAAAATRELASHSIPTPESDHTLSRPAHLAKYDKTCRTLHGLFPSQHDINIIVNSSSGALFVLSLFHTAQDYLDGLTESPASLAVVPPVTSHPAVLAKRLLQLTVCLQQLSPSFDEKQLWLRKSLSDTMAECVRAVTTLVTSNDELVGSVEGLECLILQSFYQANGGNLRKSWLSIRRAMSLAQLMGVDRRTTTALRSCDPRSDPARRASPQQLWNRIQFCDRYLSLILGLPVGAADDSFAAEDGEAAARDTPMERLEKRFTIISGRIIERNRARPAEAYALTQAIDCELEAAAKAMGPRWWVMPSLGPFGTPQQMILQMMHMMLQIHHNSLLILLHLPYMLRDPAEGRYDYSKSTCLRASREVLRRFLAFRSLNNAAFSCRHVDYSSLMAAMTLILGYLGRRPADDDAAAAKQRSDDRALVEEVRVKMDDMAVLNLDKLLRESADIIKQLVPIFDSDGGPCNCDPGEQDSLSRRLHLNIPYLGTININPLVARHAQEQAEAQAHGGSAAGADLASQGQQLQERQQEQQEEQQQQQQQQQQLIPTPSHAPASFDSMANPSLFLSIDPGFPHESAGGTGTGAGSDPFMALDGIDDGHGLSLGGAGGGDIPTHPDFTAEAGDWVFQGFDTTYWSLLNGGFNWSA